MTDPYPGVIRYVSNQDSSFNAICFDPVALERNGLTDGMAAAGRGNTVFFKLLDSALVLREYRRGGLARHISNKHYLYTGMHRTRALREFDMLVRLRKTGLPAPLPYACRVLRQGLFYTASLVTHRLPGSTLAERLLGSGNTVEKQKDSDAPWREVGRQIARFHAAGVYHADLNAHNIMLDNRAGVFLIDFDRSQLRTVPADPAKSGWCLDNINRLERSLLKIAASSTDAARATDVCKQGFSQAKAQWRESVSVRAIGD